MKKIALALGCCLSLIQAQDYLPLEVSDIWSTDYYNRYALIAKEHESEIQRVQVNKKGDTTIFNQKFDINGNCTFKSKIAQNRTQILFEAEYSDVKKKYIYKNPFYSHESYYLAHKKTYRNGKLKRQYYAEFNDHGKDTLDINFKNGQETQRTENIYLNDTILIQKTTFKKGKQNQRIIYEYNGLGQNTSQKIYNQKNELEIENRKSYDQLGHITKSETFKKGELKEYTQYTYNEYGELLKRITYNSKDEVQRVISFECSPIGEYSNKVKQYSVCEYNADLDGYLIRTEEKKNEKGIYMKKVYKYRTSDTALVNLSVYNRDNQKYWSIDYDADLQQPLKLENYKKGKKVSTKIYSYKDGLCTQVQHNQKGQLKSLIKNEYSNGIIVHVERYNAKNELVYQQWVNRRFY